MGAVVAALTCGLARPLRRAEKGSSPAPKAPLFPVVTTVRPSPEPDAGMRTSALGCVPHRRAQAHRRSIRAPPMRCMVYPSCSSKSGEP